MPEQQAAAGTAPLLPVQQLRQEQQLPASGLTAPPVHMQQQGPQQQPAQSGSPSRDQAVPDREMRHARTQLLSLTDAACWEPPTPPPSKVTLLPAHLEQWGEAHKQQLLAVHATLARLIP